VSDRRLRELERAWRASGAPGDLEAWRLARVRAGELTPAALGVVGRLREGRRVAATELAPEGRLRLCLEVSRTARPRAGCGVNEFGWVEAERPRRSTVLAAERWLGQGSEDSGAHLRLAFSPARMAATLRGVDAVLGHLALEVAGGRPGLGPARAVLRRYREPWRVPEFESWLLGEEDAVARRVGPPFGACGAGNVLGTWCAREPGHSGQHVSRSGVNVTRWDP